ISPKTTPSAPITSAVLPRARLASASMRCSYVKTRPSTGGNLRPSLKPRGVDRSALGDDVELLEVGKFPRRSGGCSCFVLVVAAHPHLAALVAARRCPVEDRVVTHQELRAAGVAGVAVIEGVTLAGERAYAVPLGEVGGKVRAGCGGVLVDRRWQLVAEPLVAQQRKRCNLVGLEQRHGLVRRLVGGGDAELEVEVALVAGGPVEAPAHPPAVGQQLLERGA